jgi:prepilin-type N-terminal cleavage/methylation domain-containing protein
MTARQQKAFTLVELLVVIAIIAVLLAILMPSLATTKSLAKRLQCSSRLGAIGKAFGMYFNGNDGLAPTMEYYADGTMEHYYAYKCRDYKNTSKDIWISMGCLYAQSLIDNPKSFYCPASEGWEEEFQKNGPPLHKWGDRPWETDNFLKSTKGYAYWPMSKKTYKDATEFGTIGPVGSGFAPTGCYKVGFPRSPMKQSDIAPSNALAADYMFHYIKGAGWNLDSLFPDGHAAFQKQPLTAAGLGMWHDTHQWPSTVYDTSTNTWLDTTEKARNVPSATIIVEFMYSLQP